MEVEYKLIGLSEVADEGGRTALIVKGWGCWILCQVVHFLTLRGKENFGEAVAIMCRFNRLLICMQKTGDASCLGLGFPACPVLFSS